MKRPFLVLVVVVLAWASQMLWADGDDRIVTVPGSEAPFQAVDRITLPVIFHFPESTYQSDNREFFTVSIGGPASIIVEEIRYPDGIEYHGSHVYRGDVTLEIDLVLPEDLPPGKIELVVTAGYQLCSDDGLCYFPQREELPISLLVVESTDEVDTREVQ